jgi:hypothetical protein
MNKPDNLIGKTFGRLTVLSLVEDETNNKKQSGKKYLCQCSCSNKTIKEVFGNNLKRGLTSSCGCLARELLSLRKKHNDFVAFDNMVIMYTRKNIPFIIDIDDFERVYVHCWYLMNSGYFGTSMYDEEQKSNVCMLLHRFIMGNPFGMKVDHKHGSNTKFDNRKSNLRIGNDFQNCVNKVPYKNKSGCVGVRYLKRIDSWQARIGVNYKDIHLGYFKNFDDAVKARKEAEEKYYGEWSHDNSRDIKCKNRIEINPEYCQRMFQLSRSIEG